MDPLQALTLAMRQSKAPEVLAVSQLLTDKPLFQSLQAAFNLDLVPAFRDAQEVAFAEVLQLRIGLTSAFWLRFIKHALPQYETLAGPDLPLDGVSLQMDTQHSVLRIVQDGQRANFGDPALERLSRDSEPARQRGELTVAEQGKLARRDKAQQVRDLRDLLSRAELTVEQVGQRIGMNAHMIGRTKVALARDENWFKQFVRGSNQFLISVTKEKLDEMLAEARRYVKASELPHARKSDAQEALEVLEEHRSVLLEQAHAALLAAAHTGRTGQDIEGEVFQLSGHLFSLTDFEPRGDGAVLDHDKFFHVHRVTLIPLLRDMLSALQLVSETPVPPSTPPQEPEQAAEPTEAQDEAPKGQREPPVASRKAKRLSLLQWMQSGRTYAIREMAEHIGDTTRAAFLIVEDDPHFRRVGQREWQVAQ